MLRDEVRLLAMVVFGGVENIEEQGEARRCVLMEGQAAVPNEIVVLVEVLDADQEVERERNLDRERIHTKKRKWKRMGHNLWW